MGLWLTPFILV